MSGNLRGLDRTIQISLQVIVGVSFIVALVGSLRRTGGISPAAMIVEVIFLLLSVSCNLFHLHSSNRP